MFPPLLFGDLSRKIIVHPAPLIVLLLSGYAYLLFPHRARTQYVYPFAGFFSGGFFLFSFRYLPPDVFVIGLLFIFMGDSFSGLPAFMHELYFFSPALILCLFHPYKIAKSFLRLHLFHF